MWYTRGLNLEQAILLFVAAVLGGGLNAIAGGGSFLAFPALLFTGVPPIPANATNTIALWSGVTASGGAYRNRLTTPVRVMAPLLIAGCIGGIAGAVLLLRTPPQTFMRILPWLMLGATLLFAFGNKLAAGRASSVGYAATARTVLFASLFELAVAIYGGYFGGGVGIVNLAMLSALGMTDIHAMNALKSVLGSVINGVAVVVFVVSRSVYWPQAGVMIVGSVLGGFFAAHYSQRVPKSWIRRTVILVGASVTVYFFHKAYFV